MSEIKLTIPQNWAEKDVQWAIKRITQIVSGDEAPVQQGSETSYSIDFRGNDWWASYDMDDRIIRVSYRYSRPDDPRMDAMRIVLRWRIGMKDAVDATS